MKALDRSTLLQGTMRYLKPEQGKLSVRMKRTPARSYDDLDFDTTRQEYIYFCEGEISRTCWTMPTMHGPGLLGQ